MSERSIFVNALIGAVVSVVLAFLPLSPIIGGAVAGYLNRREGVRVGAIAGIMAAIPFVVVVFFGVALFSLHALAVLGIIAFIIAVLAFAALYTVALSVLGGFVGVYLADEFSGGHDPSPYR